MIISALLKRNKAEYKDQPFKLYERGLGNKIQDEYEDTLCNYIRTNNVSEIKMLVSIESAIEFNELLEDSFLGVWYGIKIIDLDRNVEFLRVPVFLSEDDGLIDEKTTNQRKSNYAISAAIANYLIGVINNESDCRDIKVTVEPNIQVNEDLLYFLNEDIYTM